MESTCRSQVPCKLTTCSPSFSSPPHPSPSFSSSPISSPPISSPVNSTLASSPVIFQSCIFQSCKFSYPDFRRHRISLSADSAHLTAWIKRATHHRRCRSVSNRNRSGTCFRRISRRLARDTGCSGWHRLYSYHTLHMLLSSPCVKMNRQ